MATPDDDEATKRHTLLSERAIETATSIKKRLPGLLSDPKIAIVCGSGLGGLADCVHPSSGVEIPYRDIPGFPTSTVQGHAGKLVFGTMGESRKPIMLFVGRAHFYGGHDMSAVTFATRVCKVLGIQIMIATNAAGGLSPIYSVGDIVLLNDHINLMGLAGINPLRGPNDDYFGVRFPPLSDAYDLVLRREAHRAWKTLETTRRLHEGVYAYAAGPTYETRAECRMLRMLGADLVGMSTVPEVIVARHSGIKVLAFSLVTNCSVLEPPVQGDNALIHSLSPTELQDVMSAGSANHEEVLEAGRQAAATMQVSGVQDACANILLTFPLSLVQILVDNVTTL